MADEARAHFHALCDWLRDAGGSFDALEMRNYTATHRGVAARTDVPPDVEVLAVPKACLITVEMGRETSVGRRVIAANLDLSAIKHCFLSIFVLLDRARPDSRFAPYYAVLPKSFPGMPIFWSERDLDLLAGSHVLQQVADRKANIALDYDLIAQIAPDFAAVASLDDFLWARMMVASRNFSIVVDGVRTDALVPYADMLNHLRPRETRWAYDNRKSCFVIHSLVPLRAGQQVYDSYGKKCNSRFLTNYGFCVDNNVDEDTGQDHNELYLSLGGDDDDDSGERSVRVSMYYDYEGTREAFGALRRAACLAAELSHHAVLPSALASVAGAIHDYTGTGSATAGASGGAAPTLEVELAALGRLAELCAAQLARYPTTLEADEAELASGRAAVGSTRRNALTLLRGEKRVATHYVRLHALATSLARKPRDAAVAIADGDVPGATPDMLRYLRSALLPLLRRRGVGGGGVGAPRVSSVANASTMLLSDALVGISDDEGDADGPEGAASAKKR